ncbi:MAG: type I polyketide synthase, partial [Gammaproteobacteria bacterium]|nr:type I polyketide synthase [Gammaproteobacteria bacterium]
MGDIAIVGISGRYPKSPDLDQFWENLRRGRNCIEEIPKERWDINHYFDTTPGGGKKSYSKWGGFIEGADHFDPMLFKISAREAELIDPQERIFLQAAYHAMENAGYTARGLDTQRRVGVFAGVMWGQYQLFGVNHDSLSPSSGYWSIANRVSYTFDFAGPSMAVDTACSSSLTAIHLACESLLRGECRAAIAGGVNLSIHPEKYLLLCQNHFASSDGRCRSFGEGGDGYVPGEGVGAVVLKPLKQAQADGDHIHGVIKASVLNHGGRTNGYTVPNPVAQGELIASALEKAHIDPRTISYIETHGTGTSLGDPIEINGLTRAFGTRIKQCAIGSVKSNIGHLESAAGVAGLSKVLLQMKHQELVPSLHADPLNPHIDFEHSPFKVQQERASWRPADIDGRTTPRCAGLSSFGAGGANAHLIIEEYINPESTQSDGTPQLILLSARKPEQLQQMMAQLVDYLKANPSMPLEDIAYTLRTGRETLDERMALVVNSQSELLEQLANREGVVTGNASDYGEGADIEQRESLRQEVDSALQQQALGTLAQLWVEGADIDWHPLNQGKNLRRLPLPLYPFEQKRYWIPEPKTVSLHQQVGGGRLHPLLHSNTSNLREQKFNSQFSDAEYVLRDHALQGQHLLPAAACLEMARAGGEIANDGEVKRISDMIWIQPLIPDKGELNVETLLYPIGDAGD